MSRPGVDPSSQTHGRPAPNPRPLAPPQASSHRYGNTNRAASRRARQRTRGLTPSRFFGLSRASALVVCVCVKCRAICRARAHSTLPSLAPSSSTTRDEARCATHTPPRPPIRSTDRHCYSDYPKCARRAGAVWKASRCALCDLRSQGSSSRAHPSSSSTYPACFSHTTPQAAWTSGITTSSHKGWGTQTLGTRSRCRSPTRYVDGCVGGLWMDACVGRRIASPAIHAITSHPSHRDPIQPKTRYNQRACGTPGSRRRTWSFLPTGAAPPAAGAYCI